ncbi:superoxide dismutase [Cu-Zn] [Salmonella enterica subsp. enterica serovar Choleraesuis]|nr:superoxide dismutase [Cu-Zn] [Salmonella enterica subsp. enterica serovar Choleraesuis]
MMKKLVPGLIIFAISTNVWAASVDVEMNQVTPEGIGKSVGNVKISETEKGLEFTPDLTSLSPGEHGFHIHAKGSCQPALKLGQSSAAESAGGHLDPGYTGKHEGPEGTGHQGDLPVLVVSQDGRATQSVVAPRLKKLDDIKGKALMIHSGGDNFSDQPKPLGGGGDRIVCGVIK